MNVFCTFVIVKQIVQVGLALKSSYSEMLVNLKPNIQEIH